MVKLLVFPSQSVITELKKKHTISLGDVQPFLFPGFHLKTISSIQLLDNIIVSTLVNLGTLK